MNKLKKFWKEHQVNVKIAKSLKWLKGFFFAIILVIYKLLKLGYDKIISLLEKNEEVDVEASSEK